MQNEPRGGRQIAASGRVDQEQACGGSGDMKLWDGYVSVFFFFLVLVFTASCANSIDSSLLLRCLEVTPGAEMDVLS